MVWALAALLLLLLLLPRELDRPVSKPWKENCPSSPIPLRQCVAVLIHFLFLVFFVVVVVGVSPSFLPSLVSDPMSRFAFDGL